MNELIILGILCAIFGMFFLLYAVVGVVYYKFILHSKKSIFEIISEL